MMVKDDSFVVKESIKVPAELFRGKVANNRENENFGLMIRWDFPSRKVENLSQFALGF